MGGSPGHVSTGRHGCWCVQWLLTWQVSRPCLLYYAKRGGKNLGTSYDARYSGQRQNLSASLSSARTYQSRQLDEWNLAPSERLAGFAIGNGEQEQPVAAAFFAVNWILDSCSDMPRRGSLHLAQIRSERVPRSVNRVSSFFARRSSAQLRRVPFGASGPADTTRFQPL